MRKAGHNAAMVKLSVDGMRKVAGEVDAMLRPLLTSLAVAHLRLGADGVALAYATAAAQVVFQQAPPVAACVAAQVLNRLGLKTGACAALYMVRCECMLCMHTYLHTTPVLMLPRPLRRCCSWVLFLRKCRLSDFVSVSYLHTGVSLDVAACPESPL